ncbi:MAG: choice-of-anchor Q domain-containing protein [Candidatus Competibacteraceae bacterium]
MYYDNITLTNSTVSGNSASIGGGVYTYYADVTLSNSILSGNTDDNLYSVEGSVSAAYSVLGEELMSLGGSNIFSNTPGLAELGDNGCTTPAGVPGSDACVQTRALQDGSPALDAANNDVCAADPINNLDQRGVARPQPMNGVCDIGAYESVADTLTITKQTLPDGSAQTFTFSGAVSGDIGDDVSLSEALPAGQYTVSETVPAGWDLTEVNCDGGNPTVDLNAASVVVTLNGDGDTITCTFTNTQRGRIDIRKQTLPEGAPGSFDFSGDLGTFSLQDEGNETFLDLPAGTTYMITEADPPPGFDLTDISCDDQRSPTPSTGDLPSRTATVGLDPAEFVICTFTNSQRAELNITVDVIGLNLGTAFDFTTVNLDPTQFSLQAGEIQTFANLLPGQSYTVNERTPPGWVLEEVLCEEDPPANPPACQTGSITVTPLAGQTVTGTFRFRFGTTGGGGPEANRKRYRFSRYGAGARCWACSWVLVRLRRRG